MPKVLIIDDDMTFQTVMSAKLKEKGYETDLALNGAAGLLKMAESRPDVILLDIMMPKLDGIGFLKQLQADRPSDTKIPVFITSNLNDLDKVSEGAELGVRGYIVKSDESLDTIVSAIDSVCHSPKEEK
ncbi:MAG: Alkaline phosphatase synthesis transcriptional regulatory protein PhoP, two-component system, OmpR [Parcubacteria group bacterium]|nr:Alkaline phosphatase synthesis transcriptional regulatory protein PhoP, two-component system, OmpR [Parcubacteria group bacterium]